MRIPITDSCTATLSLMIYQRHGRSDGPYSDIVAIRSDCVVLLSDFVALPRDSFIFISDSDFADIRKAFVAILSDLVALPSDCVAILC